MQKGEEKFWHDVYVLLHSWNAGTLAKGSTCACAVGNLIAHGLNYSLTPINGGANLKWNSPVEYDVFPTWSAVFCTMRYHKEQNQTPQEYGGSSKKEIDATHYTWQELARVEHAFETASPQFGREDAYISTLAVCGVLGELNGVSAEKVGAARALFVL